MLDLTKPLQTVSGRPVTLITTKGREPWPLVGYIVGMKRVTVTWKQDGAFQPIGENELDLINTPD